MQQNKLTPFPTLVEIIRAIANAFDSKWSNKSLDDKAYDSNVDHRKIENFLIDSIEVPLKKKISEDFAQTAVENIQQAIECYIHMVKSISLDYVSRRECLPLLLELWFPPFAVNFLNDIHNKAGGPKPTDLVSSNDLAMRVVIDWIADHQIGWQGFIKSCSKDQIDLIASWKRGRQLPSLPGIGSIDCWSHNPKGIDWNQVKTLLIVARTIDWLRKTEVGKLALNEVRNLCWSVCPQKNCFDELERCQLEYSRKFEGIELSLVEIQNKLSKAKRGEEFNSSELEEDLQRVKNLLKHNKCGEKIGYRLSFLEAQWQVIKGKLDVACKHYGKAFQGGLYRGGEKQEQIINQALVVASSIKHPDKVFLKQLKNMKILFQLEIPTDDRKKENLSYTFSGIVEEWEIEMWKAHLSHYFPCYESSSTLGKTGPVALTDKDLKPDYRYPNRIMKLGAPWKKSMPQLIWFVMIKEFEIVKKLLHKGADVNLCSENNETAIGVAVENLHIENNPTSVDFDIFHLLAQQEHKKETVNKRTAKKQLLPIMSAVGTGRPEIVKQILEMGAEPNGHYSVGQTPLYVCIYYIAILTKYTDRSADENSIPVTRESLDLFRRNTNGYYWFSLKHQLDAFTNMMGSPLFNELISHSTDNTKNQMSVDSLYEIAKILLEYGADPNAVQCYPLAGYTPLMYAAEIDEGRMFEMMLDNGGDPLKTYTNPRDGQHVGCIRIAQEFGSRCVMKILNNKAN